MTEYLFPGLAAIAALLAAIAVLFAASLSLHARTRFETLTLPLLVALLLINMAIQPVLNGRDLRFIFVGIEFLPTGFQSAWTALAGKALLRSMVIQSVCFFTFSVARSRQFVNI